jgi:hypothetical protein
VSHPRVAAPSLWCCNFDEERPLQCERLKAEGRLDEHVAPAPSRRFEKIAHALGFSLLGVWGILLVLAIPGFAQKGPV